MAKKRKSVATHLDEADRNIYSTFCSAANSLSQLYTQSMSQQKLSFQAGERHSLNKLEYGTEETPMSPRLPFQQNQQYQTAMHLTGSGIPVLPNSSGPVSTGQGLRSVHIDHQAKNIVFSNALSSPVRHSLQNYHLGQGG